MEGAKQNKLKVKDIDIWLEDEYGTVIPSESEEAAYVCCRFSIEKTERVYRMLPNERFQCVLVSKRSAHLKGLR